MQISQYNFDHGITIFNLGDIHRGDHACDVDLFYRAIDAIDKNPNARWVSTGDMLNTAVRGGKFDSIYHSDKLEKEYEALLMELGVISDKCLGITSSNHPGRVGNLVGIDIDKVICRELGIPYLGDLGLINVTCQRTSYFVAMHHGSPGHGKLKGAKANNLESMEQLVPGADIYLTGHTHTYMSFINEANYIDRKRNILTAHKQWFCTTGHCLKWESSYAPKLRLRPAPAGFATLELAASMNGQHGNKNVRIDLFS